MSAVCGPEDATKRGLAAEMAGRVKVLATESADLSSIPRTRSGSRESIRIQQNALIHTLHIKDLESGTHLLCQFLKILGGTIRASYSTPTSVNKKNEMCAYIFLEAFLTVKK